VQELGELQQLEAKGEGGEEVEGDGQWLRAVLRHNAHGPEFKAYAQVCVCMYKYRYCGFKCI
jgi:hypothetical protein